MRQLQSDLNSEKFAIGTKDEFRVPIDLNYGLRFNLYDVTDLLRVDNLIRISDCLRASGSQNIPDDIGYEWFYKCLNYPSKKSLYPDARLGSQQYGRYSVAEFVEQNEQTYVLFTSCINNRLVKFEDDASEINFWQHEYAEMHAKLLVSNMFDKYKLKFDSDKFISTPAVQYDSNTDEVYNYVIKVKANEPFIVPLYFGQRTGGCYVVTSSEDAVVPCGLPRQYTRDEASNLSYRDPIYSTKYNTEARDMYSYMTSYSCIEFMPPEASIIPYMQNNLPEDTVIRHLKSKLR